MNKKSKGFTLVELLIVIAVIGILLGIASFSFTSAQKQGRDARRREDMSDVQTAMEQYYAVNGDYPTLAGGTLDDAFQNTVPVDPKNDATYFYDWDNTSTSAYCICAQLESGTGNADAPPASGSCNWNSSGSYLCVQNQQ